MSNQAKHAAGLIEELCSILTLIRDIAGYRPNKQSKTVSDLLFMANSMQEDHRLWAGLSENVKDSAGNTWSKAELRDRLKALLDKLS